MVIFGQIMGWVAVVLAFISYQCKEHKKLLIVQTLLSLSLTISYFCLEAWSGMLLNIVCIIRNFIIFRKDLKIFSYSFWPYALAALIGVVGFLSWQGPMSLLIIVALIINTLFLSFPNVQNLRKSIIITSIMVIIYDAYFTVWGGIVNEMIAIISSIIGIIRFKNKSAK